MLPFYQISEGVLLHAKAQKKWTCPPGCLLRRGARDISAFLAVGLCDGNRGSMSTTTDTPPPQEYSSD